MTYNVHGCIGRDGLISPYRISEVIAAYNPDIVALQELDVKRIRTGAVDQPKLIANNLKMYFHFHPSLELEEERYGNAILSRFELHVLKSGALPGLPSRTDLEKRSALWAAALLEGTRIQIFNTHLGLNRHERLAQADALLGPEWLRKLDNGSPVIVCGDFNALPASSVYTSFASILRDVQSSLGGRRPKMTYPSGFPVFRLDHIFVSREFTIHGVDVPRTRLTRTASDHLPVIAELSL